MNLQCKIIDSAGQQCDLINYRKVDVRQFSVNSNRLLDAYSHEAMIVLEISSILTFYHFHMSTIKL